MKLEGWVTDFIGQRNVQVLDVSRRTIQSEAVRWGRVLTMTKHLPTRKRYRYSTLQSSRISLA